jgi:hypothetical protein
MMRAARGCEAVTGPGGWRHDGKVGSAEDRKQDVPTPAALPRTHEDAEMRLFVGSSIGGCYSIEDIGALRIFCRHEARQSPFEVDATQALHSRA